MRSPELAFRGSCAQSSTRNSRPAFNQDLYFWVLQSGIYLFSEIPNPPFSDRWVPVPTQMDVVKAQGMLRKIDCPWICLGNANRASVHVNNSPRQCACPLGLSEQGRLEVATCKMCVRRHGRDVVLIEDCRISRVSIVASTPLAIRKLNHCRILLACGRLVLQLPLCLHNKFHTARETVIPVAPLNFWCHVTW